MNARIKKEMRSLQTMFLVTVAAVIVGSCLLNGSDGAKIIATAAFAFLSACLGVTVFGTEFNWRTMGFLLTQPVSRRRLWQEKMMVLGAALMIAWLVMLMSIHVLIIGEGKPVNFFDLAGATFLVILLVFCSAPCLTLMCRNYLGGVGASLVLPGMVFLVLMFLAWLGGKLSGQGEPWFATTFEQHPAYFIVSLALIYCAVTYRLGYRQFLNFQVAGAQAKELSLPAAVETRLAPIVKIFIPGYSGPTASLVRKELQVQRATFIFSGVMAIMILCARLANLFSGGPHGENPGLSIWDITGGITMASIMIYLVCVPFIAGVVSMAEERNWGTVGWQLTFPVSRWKQALVKLAMTYLTAIFLGLVIPLMVALPTGKLSDLFRGEFEVVLLAWLWTYLPVFNLVVFASSISTNTMRATALYFGLLIAAVMVFGLGTHWINLMMPYGFRSYPVQVGTLLRWSQAWHISPAKFSVYVRLGTAILALCWLLPLMGIMILTNYKNDETNLRRRWIQSSVIVVTLGGSAAGLATVVAFIISFEAAFNIH